MPNVKRIVCLANSRKLSGRCVAGKVWPAVPPSTGWVRPVSARPHQEVSEHERQYQDGSDPRVLDIIDVPLLTPCPASYQSENWLLDPNFYWVKSGNAGWTDLGTLVDAPGPLWTNGDSTYHGTNDRVADAVAASLTSSLRLVRVDGVGLSVFQPGAAFGNPKRRVQAAFVHSGVTYRLWVTDPIYERRYLAMVDGQYQIGPAFLTVSLGESHNGACYKLIAAIIERP